MTSASLGAGGGVRAREGTVVEVFTVVDLLNDECLCVSVCVCGCISACLHFDFIASQVLCFLVQQLETGHVCSNSFEKEVCGW